MSNFQDLPSWKELTKEQQDQLKQVIKSSRKRGAYLGLKMGVALITSNIFIIMINLFFVNSNTFGFVGGVVNGLMLYHIFKNSFKQEHDRITSDVKKILNK